MAYSSCTCLFFSTFLSAKIFHSTSVDSLTTNYRIKQVLSIRHRSIRTNSPSNLVLQHHDSGLLPLSTIAHDRPKRKYIFQEGWQGREQSLIPFREGHMQPGMVREITKKNCALQSRSNRALHENLKPLKITFARKNRGSKQTPNSTPLHHNHTTIVQKDIPTRQNHHSAHKPTNANPSPIATERIFRPPPSQNHVSPDYTVYRTIQRTHNSNLAIIPPVISLNNSHGFLEILRNTRRSSTISLSRL